MITRGQRVWISLALLGALLVISHSRVQGQTEIFGNAFRLPLSTQSGNLAVVALNLNLPALNAISLSTTVPALVGQSTGYYAGLFYNITNLGSDLANANAIGLVAQSVYSNAFYAQQGGVLGSPGDTLARDNIYPALFVTRVVGSLNGFNYTAPVLRLDDTTTSTGTLMDAKRGGVVVMGIASDGIPFFGGIAGTAGSPDFRPTAVNGGMIVFNSAFSGDGSSTPIWLGGRTTAGNVGNVSVEAAQATAATRPDMIFRTGGTTQVAFGSERFRITISGALRPAPFVFANIATVLTTNGEYGYCSDCRVTTGTPGNPSTITNNTCQAGGNGSLVVRLNAVNVCVQ